jgi:hypothetical protein
LEKRILNLKNRNSELTERIVVKRKEVRFVLPDLEAAEGGEGVTLLVKYSE